MTKMYNCSLCTKTSKTSADLYRHVLSHTKEKPHNKCSQCPAAFGRLGNLNSHVRSVHDGIKRIQKRNHDKATLKNHLFKHSSDRPFSCDMPSCGFKTKYKRTLFQHGRSVHSDERPYACPTDRCNYRSKTKQYLRIHRRIHRNEKTFACTVPGCTYTSNWKEYFKAHTSRMHSVENPFKCSICDYRAKVRSDLTRHQLTHMKMKRFHCQVPNCGYASTQKSKFQRHLYGKHKKKKVLCTESGCNFKCASTTQLKRHLKRHELPNFKCSGGSCNFSTRFKKVFLKHMSRCHTDLQSPVSVEASFSDIEIADRASTVGTLHCRFPYCGYQTTLPQHFDRHTDTHKKEEKRDQVCPFCFSRFSNWSALKDHIQRHVGEKPYSCSFCNYKAVRDSSDLRSHARIFHHIHVIPRSGGDALRKCRTCGKTGWGYNEFVLHSMIHLQPVVLLERLNLHIS